jgi:uncharacterized membrane protein
VKIPALRAPLPKVGGALFLGTPNDTALWSDITAHRDAPSPQWLPIYGDGATVRFAASSADLGRPATTWTSRLSRSSVDPVAGLARRSAARAGTLFGIFHG